MSVAPANVVETSHKSMGLSERALPREVCNEIITVHCAPEAYARADSKRLRAHACICSDSALPLSCCSYLPRAMAAPGYGYANVLCLLVRDTLQRRPGQIEGR